MTAPAAALKMRIREALAGLYQARGRRASRWGGKVIILAYHRVLSAKDLSGSVVQPGMYVLRDAFESQMRFVREHFEVLSLARLLERWREGGLDASHGYCVVTFDDGWADNYAHAYPILQSLGIPATIFLATQFVGTEEWFWPDRLVHVLGQRHGLSTVHEEEARVGQGRGKDAERGNAIDSTIERWKLLGREEIERRLHEMTRACGVNRPRGRVVLTWSEIAEMSQNGISFGSHSCTHAILTRLPLQETQREIEDSLKMLRERNVNVVPVFCYPNGEYTDEIGQQVRAAGYMGAMTTEFGWEGLTPRDLFRIRRIGVHQDISRTVPLFTFHIAGLNRVLSRSRWAIETGRR